MPQTKKRVIFFGDSITEQGAQPGGFIRRIDTLCQGEKKSDLFDFVGSGVSGNKVYDLYLRLEDDVINQHPDIVIIFIGVNDVWHKRSSGTGTDADKFEKFYEAIIRKLKEQHIRIIVCTPAVIGERTDFTNQQDGDMNLYSDIIRKIASRDQLTLVDLRKAFLEYDLKNNPSNKDGGILTTDGVHLNGAGNKLVATELWKALQGP